MIFSDEDDVCYSRNDCLKRLAKRYQHYIKGKTATLEWWEAEWKKFEKWADEGMPDFSNDAEEIVQKMRKDERKKRERRKVKQQMRDRSPTRFQE